MAESKKKRLWALFYIGFGVFWLKNQGNKKPGYKAGFLYMAEEERFELSIGY
ncbi:hypothetical protein N8600_05505 [Gammaproteobacteria bacterium]|nr:hypothetical protein [Gammaproteobacteria bacterium]